MTGPGAMAPLMTRWGLTPDGPAPVLRYQGDTPTGAVAFVRRGEERLVLKLLTPGSDEAQSAAVLTHWDGQGAVRLVEAVEGAILMERAAPGEDLAEHVRAGRDDEATLILCEVVAKLRRPAPAEGGYRRIEDWGAGFDRNRDRAIALGIEARLIDHAAEVFDTLAATQGEPILLHGDLHHYNIVRDERRGWLAIDPKGVLGEAAYETGALIRNPIEDFALCARADIVERRARLIAERLGYDYQRVVGWAFAQWMLADLWAIQDGISFAPEWLDGPRAAETLLAL
ncbi:MAG: aminoglycoside phosphotransferase family protein [Caulobacterales bacterium]